MLFDTKPERQSETDVVRERDTERDSGTPRLDI